MAWGRPSFFYGSFEELVLRKHGQQIARFTIVKHLACLLDDVPSEHQCDEDYMVTLRKQLDKILKQLIGRGDDSMKHFKSFCY